MDAAAAASEKNHRRRSDLYLVLSMNKFVLP